MRLSNYISRLARSTWPQLYPDTKTEPRIPSIQDLSADILEPYMTEARQEYIAIFVELDSGLGGASDHQGPSANLDELDNLCLNTLNVLVRTHGQTTIQIRDRDVELAPDTVILRGFESVHRLYIERGLPTTHPLQPFVKAWQRKPVDISPNTRKNRIMPSRLAMVGQSDSRAAPRGRRPGLFSAAAHAESDQVALPGFGVERATTMPALPLALYDLGMEGKPSRGPAPLALRLWVESILSTGLDERLIDQPLAMQVSLRDLRARLWPKSAKSISTNKLKDALFKAAEALDSWEAAWPWYDAETGRGGTRRIVIVSDIGNTLDDTLRIVVDLPPGAAEGPQVTPTLGEWGARSADAYRTLLNLAYHWHRPGQTHMPVAGGKHWIRRKTIDAYPELSNTDMIALVFPTGSKTSRRDQFYRARQTLNYLEKAGELRRRGRRILPPSVGR